MGKLNKNKRKARQNSNREKTDDVMKLTSDALTPKVTSKKTKRRQKRSVFISKLSASNEAKEKLKKAKQRAQTVIVGDMHPLLDALSDVNIITKKNNEGSEQKNEQGLKKKRMPSEKNRLKSDLKDVNLFHQVTSHPKYVNNPINAITDHVKYLIQKECGDE